MQHLRSVTGTSPDARGVEQSPSRAPVRVAFIGATGRSGSTLLSRVLGSVPGVCSVGELHWLWSYGVQRDRACGCGQPFSRCPFWTGVGRRAFGGWGQLDAERATALRRDLTRNARIPALWTGGRGRLAADVEEYAGLLSQLYTAIRDESGAQVVVDNSKQTGAALLARRAAGVRLSVVHLVRRSHGVAYSWTKHVPRSDKDGTEMRRRTAGRTAVKWTMDNALFETLGRSGTSRLLLRYEDFVAEPRRETLRLLEALEVPAGPDAMSFLSGNTVDLATDHSVWGNPMRLRTGPQQLRPDDAWVTGMPRRTQQLVTALSLPGLLRYGYLR
ncbi:MAG TPA: hypothetical protein VFR07_11185 [Mycobacteriales bacterium]|jgi:hypothetical protein|nr:hypothetical protein [Mycobacteriales bacterium]